MSVSSPVPAQPVSMSPSLPAGSTAVVYCEGHFGEQDGKTANGLVRHSERYEILASSTADGPGSTPGRCSTARPNGIPVVANLAEAIAHAGRVPDYLICGLAPPTACCRPPNASCCSTPSPAACTSSTVCTSSSTTTPSSSPPPCWPA